jgi:hypothetical protein
MDCGACPDGGAGTDAAVDGPANVDMAVDGPPADGSAPGDDGPTTDGTSGSDGPVNVDARADRGVLGVDPAEVRGGGCGCAIGSLSRRDTAIGLTSLVSALAIGVLLARRRPGARRYRPRCDG